MVAKFGYYLNRELGIYNSLLKMELGIVFGILIPSSPLPVPHISFLILTVSLSFKQNAKLLLFEIIIRLSTLSELRGHLKNTNEMCNSRGMEYGIWCNNLQKMQSWLWSKSTI